MKLVISLGLFIAIACGVEIHAQTLLQGNLATGSAPPPTGDISCSAGTPSYSSTLTTPSTNYGVLLPAKCVDETMPTITGNVTAIHDTGNVTTNGTNFENALNAACLGDEIVLDAGVKYDRAGFLLPNIGCSHGAGGWLIVTSSALASLPPAGTRIDPTDRANTPILETTSNSAAVLYSASNVPVHNIRFIGLSLTDTSAVSGETFYLCAQLGSFAQTTTSQLANHIIFDRVWCAPWNTTLQVRHGILIDGEYNAVIDSYIDYIWDTATDAQALFSVAGDGPILVRNNYLVGGGENMIWGGDDNQNATLNPSDITVYNNFLAKPFAWLSGSYDIKELFEMKNSTRILIFNNTLWNNAAQGQSGSATLFRSVNQEGACTWCRVWNATMQQNVFVNSPRGFNTATELGTLTYPTTNVDIYDNLMYGIGTYPFLVVGDTAGNTMSNINYVNNTIWGTGSMNSAIYFGWSPYPEVPLITGFNFVNNVWSTNGGVLGDGLGQGNATMAAMTAGTVYLTNNILAGASSGSYSSYPGNYFGSNPSVVNASCGNYSLSSPGSYGPPAVGAQHIQSCSGTVPASFTCSFQHAGNCSSVPIPTAIAPQVGFVQASNAPYQGYTISSCATCPSGTSDLTIDFAGVLALTATGISDASHGATWSPTISAANAAGAGTGVISVTFQ